MKKTLILLLIGIMVLTTGCSNKSGNTESKSEGKEVVNEENVKHSEDLGDDLYSFELLINGDKFMLPCDYKDLSDKGWNIKSNADAVLAPNEYSMSTDMINGEKTFCARFLNIGANELPYNECKVGGVIISDLDVKKGIEVELPKGINMKSSKDDIIKAYGEPTKSSESGDLVYLNYELGNYQKIQFTINQKKNEVTKLQMDNMIDGKNNSTSSKPDTASQENGTKSTTELGDDLFSKNVELEGYVYTLPASIKEFQQNGWIVQDEAGKSVKSKDTNVRVSLRKNNSVIKVSAKNNTSNETEVENCDITKIEVREENKISLKLPKGIGIGSSKEELESAYSGLEKKKSDSSNYDYYSYQKDGLSININVSKQSGKVVTVEMNYMK